MKAITFLGAATAHPTTYVMSDGRECIAKFCGVALAHFYPNLQMRVFVTSEARQMHLNNFLADVGQAADKVEPIDIPDGHDESQLWQIFQAVIDTVAEKEQVIFDMTHGYRSLPFLSFLAAAYLRITKQVELVGLLYGNFEARDKSVTPNRAPVIDLTAFVSLLDWMIAADQFIRFGDAQDLATQLRKTQHQPPTKADLSLNQAIRTLNKVSRSLQLIRPLDAMAASEELGAILPKIMVTLPEDARPFSMLAQQIGEAYAPLALKQKAQSDIAAALSTERQLVHWYIDRKQYVQAVAVAREWLVTWLMAQLGHTDQRDRIQRSTMEQILGARIRGKQNEQEASSLLPNVSHISQIDEISTLYGQLGDLRNDLLHAGKRLQPLSVETLEKNIRKYCQKLDEFDLPTNQ